MRNEEHIEQVAVVKWFRLQFPTMANNLFSIPNGSHLAGNTLQRCKQMQSLKNEGFLPGVSDLFLMIPSQTYHGLFIEMKRKKGGSTSEPQKRFIKNAINHGYQAKVCHGSEQAINTIKEYIKGVV